MAETAIREMDGMGRDVSPRPARTIEEMDAELWRNRILALETSLVGHCRERARQLVADAMQRIDWDSIAATAVAGGLDAEEAEERLRASLAEMLAEALGQ